MLNNINKLININSTIKVNLQISSIINMKQLLRNDERNTK